MGCPLQPHTVRTVEVTAGAMEVATAEAMVAHREEAAATEDTAPLQPSPPTIQSTCQAVALSIIESSATDL
jgi:hypothetical protein